jgi:hypothetical protein
MLRAAALTVAFGTAAVALPANAAGMHGGFAGGGGFHSSMGGGFHGGGAFHGGGVRGGVGHGAWFHGGGVHTGWNGGGWHNGHHGHFRGNVFIVDPGWYGYGDYYAPYADDNGYNAYCDPNSAYYDPDYCY